MYNGQPTWSRWSSTDSWLPRQLHTAPESVEALHAYIAPPEAPWLLDGRFLGLETALEITLGIGLLLREVLEVQTCLEDPEDRPEQRGFPEWFGQSLLSMDWMDMLAAQSSALQMAVLDYQQYRKNRRGKKAQAQSDKTPTGNGGNE